MEFIRLSRLSFSDSEQLAKSSIKWNGGVDPEVFKLVEDKAQGNPLMIKEVRCSRLPATCCFGCCLREGAGFWK